MTKQRLPTNLNQARSTSTLNFPENALGVMVRLLSALMVVRKYSFEVGVPDDLATLYVSTAV